MKRLLGSIWLVMLLTTNILSQNGTRMLGYDARSMGRGGVSIGIFDSPELMMTNPAGISFLEKSCLNADISLMFPSVHFKNQLNDADGDKNTFPLPELSYVYKPSESKFSWGAGVFTAGGMGADYSLKHGLYQKQDGVYNLQNYHSQLAAMHAGLSVAYQINDQLSAGASLHLVFSTLEFEMPYSLDPSIMKGTAQPGGTFGQMFSAPPSMNGFGYTEVTASAKMNDLTGIGVNGKIGVAYKVNDRLALGLSYTLPTTLTYKNGNATMDMTEQFKNAFGRAMQGYMQQNPGTTEEQAYNAVAGQFGQMGVNLAKGVKADYDLEVELIFPQSIGFGASYIVYPDLQFGLDFEWLNWEKAFDKMTLKLNNGNNSNINTMLGNSGDFNLDFPLNWKNAVIIKLGGEYKASKTLAVRLGYAYGGNPVPESTIFPVFPAIVEQHVTVGCSYNVSDPLTIHSAIEMALNKSLTSSNPSLIANEYDGSTSELSTLIVHLSCTYTF